MEHAFHPFELVEKGKGDVRHGNWVTIRRKEWSFCAPVSSRMGQLDARVATTRYKTLVSAAVQPTSLDQPAVFDACGVARLAALSRTKSSRPPDPFIPRQGKKGAKEKARFYWTSALLHRQLHIAPPIKLSLLASVTRAFFSLFLSFLP